MATYGLAEQQCDLKAKIAAKQVASQAAFEGDVRDAAERDAKAYLQARQPEPCVHSACSMYPVTLAGVAGGQIYSNIQLWYKCRDIVRRATTITKAEASAHLMLAVLALLVFLVLVVVQFTLARGTVRRQWLHPRRTSPLTDTRTAAPALQ